MRNNINLETVDIKKIHPNPWNPNVQSEFIFGKQKQSLQDEGQVLPILVREIKKGQYEIIDGEHRYKAALEEGAESIVVNNLGKMSDAKAKMLGQKINRTNGQDDPAKLKDLYLSLLEELDKEDIIGQLPVTELQFEEAIKNVDTDWMDMPSDSRKGDGKGDDEFVKISISVPKSLKEQFDDQMDRFKKILYPNENPKNVSEVMPFEAMLQVLAQTPDNHIIGGDL